MRARCSNKTKAIGGIDVAASLLLIDQLRQQITTYCDLADRVIDQTRRRVLLGEQVPSEQKVYSIFGAPHRSDQAGQGSQTGGIRTQSFPGRERPRTDHRLPRAGRGNPVDSDHVESSLDRHQQTFQHPPEWYAGDRGFYSADNVQRCHQAGGRRSVHPTTGRKEVSAGAGSAGTQPGIQESSTIPGRHRGPYLRVVLAVAE